MTRIPLPAPVPAALAEELARRIHFVSEEITGFSLIRSGDRITDVEVSTSPAASGDAAGLARKLRAVVAGDVLGQRAVAPKVVWRAEAPGRPARDVFDELLARGAAAELGPGQIVLGEPVLSLMDRLDDMLRALVTGEFGAHEYRYPTLLTADALHRTGYAESFPQLLMCVARLHTDADSYRAFLDSLAGDGELSRALHRHAGVFGHCLPPTMCFHTYHQYADRALEFPSLTVTSRGRSFRHESRYSRSLERLWDFTIREIVFLGDPDFVLSARARLMERSYALMEFLGLGGRCEVAGDPFFLHESTATRTWSQRLLEQKYELRLPLDEETQDEETQQGGTDGEGGTREVSVASFNYHEQFFGRSFGIIDGAGDPVFSGCAGFGLERLAFAFLCRHGVEPEGWPAAVRKVVGS